jgi:hypothetical protein
LQTADVKSQIDARRSAAGSGVGLRVKRLPVLAGLLLAVALGAGQDSVARPGLPLIRGGPVSVTAKRVGRQSKLTVGDPFEVELTVRRERAVNVSDPFLPEPGPFILLDKKSITRYKGDTIIDVHRLKLAPVAAGDLQLPPFLVGFAHEEGMVAAASESLPVKVASVLPKDSMKDINDLKPQQQYPNPLPFVILGAVVAAAALGFFGRRLYRRWRRRQLLGAPLLDPWDEALAALGAVPETDLLSAGQYRRLYYSVSEILKRYLERRFEFPASEQTTTEIGREMKARRTPEAERFRDFFRAADMVKYAKHRPEPAAAQAVVTSARELVRLTTPAPESDERRGMSKEQDGGAAEQR